MLPNFGYIWYKYETYGKNDFFIPGHVIFHWKAKCSKNLWAQLDHWEDSRWDSNGPHLSNEFLLVLVMVGGLQRRVIFVSNQTEFGWIGVLTKSQFPRITMLCWFGYVRLSCLWCAGGLTFIHFFICVLLNLPGCYAHITILAWLRLA